MAEKLACLSVYRGGSSIWMRTWQDQNRSHICKRVLLTPLRPSKTLFGQMRFATFNAECVAAHIRAWRDCRDHPLLQL